MIFFNKGGGVLILLLYKSRHLEVEQAFIMQRHEERRFIVRKVAQLMPTPYKPPTGRRHYFLELKSMNGSAIGIPVSFDIRRLERTQLEAIKDGRLREAYELFWIMGTVPKTDILLEYPWWDEFMANYFHEKCIMCAKGLDEDRALNRNCRDQMCTFCAVATIEDGTTQCPKCDEPIDYILFNGEQCDDNRSHPDVILS